MWVILLHIYAIYGNLFARDNIISNAITHESFGVCVLCVCVCVCV
jgi:hypothetical protein